jgi:hypothetical protein
VTPEQAAALQKYRDARDPLLKYRPRPTQDAFHRSNARHKLLTGGNRSGKTSGGLCDVGWLARNTHPYHKWVQPVRLFMWCQSRAQGAGVVGRKLFVKSELSELPNFPMIPPHEIAELDMPKLGGQRVPIRCLMKNGAEILFGWSGVESSWKRAQGLELDGVCFDENACEGDLLNESLARLADARARYRETEPWRGFCMWFASGTQVDENFERFRTNCLDPEQPDWELFQIPSAERPAELKSELDNIGKSLTAEQRRIRIEGDSTATEELLIYRRQWSDARHMRAFDYEVQPTDNLWAVIDPGVDHPTALGFFAINAANPLKQHWVKCFLQKRLTAEEEVELVTGFLRGRILEGFIYDPAAHKTEKSGLSVKNQWAALLARRGVRMVRGMIPGRNRVTDGINRVRSYLDPNPLDSSVEPLVEFNPSEASGCQMMRQQILAYRSYEANKYQGARGVVKRGDDLVDILRYACSLTPAYNPTIGCGLPEPESPPQIAVPTAEQIRTAAQFERSRQIHKTVNDRDLGFTSLGLW